MHNLKLTKEQIDNLLKYKYDNVMPSLVQQLKQTVHLCDYCSKEIRTCNIKHITFGFGNANVIQCDVFKEKG